MKQIAQYQDGRLELQDVPQPTAPAGGVLVRVTHSVISVGTERMKVEQARMNLIQKARARPDQVRKVLDTARTLGWSAALEKVRNRMETPTPLGYSAAGIVDAVGTGHTRLRVGDRVACAGAECAWHAEYIAVPDRLTAKVPDGVENWQAAYATIGAIALQAVRQAEVALGDRVLVLGQGLMGLTATALLRADGARVLAVDIAAGRHEVARAMGAELFVAGNDHLADTVRAWTEGYGVDAALLATSTQSNSPTEQAVEALRDRGRLVVLGNTKVDLPWKSAYEKEIEVRYSRSYGPGRYDPSYEWDGVDYPIGYVRWTEQRNLEAVLHLMQTGALDPSTITSRRLPFTRALEAYQDLVSGAANDIGVVLEYDPPPGTPGGQNGTDRPRAERVTTPGAVPGRSAPIDALDVIGAGNFARTMLLPHLKGRVAFGTVVNNTALSARHVQAKFGFASAGTDADALLSPGRLEQGEESKRAVLIATRHHLHGRLVVKALETDRHVFVEKPLCLTEDELAAIDSALARSRGTVQVGFNRRFAPATVALKRLLQATPGPKTASYRVVPGKLDPLHWYANYQESGGRVLGEGCHFLDYFCCLFESAPVRVFAQTTWPTAGRLPFADSVTAQVEFADGSSGQLIYTGEGDPSWPKEQCTVYGTGFVAELTNCQELVVHRDRRRSKRSFSGKGHAEQMAAWAAFLRGESEHPLSYSAARTGMQVTFAVLESIRRAECVTLPTGEEGGVEGVLATQSGQT